ncbi:MAG: hypothetical protein DI585_06090 [Pseudomonas fluorescens]|nr:MAG: hypothetical protein DI585_06090 [Pseudomonas fluorescens]
MNNSLRHAITSFHEQLERRQQERRTERIAKTCAEHQIEDAPIQMVPLHVSPDVRAFFNRVSDSVNLDRDRYLTEMPTPILQGPVTDLSSIEDGHEAAMLAKASISPSVHMLNLWDQWQRHEKIIPNTAADTLTGQNICAALLLAEVNYLMQDSSQRSAMAASLLMKVKQSVQAFIDGRTNDAVTLLKNALHNDPHNHSILMILSQIMYWLAARGVQNVLPEARDYAQRSTIFSEKHQPSQMAFYRYTAIVTERSVGAERALEWLRETGALDISNMTEKNSGIMAERGMYLRCWYIFSTIPAELWQEQDLKAIKGLVTKVIGGAAVYMMWLRAPLLALASLSKTPPPIVEEIERYLQTSMRIHATHAAALKQLPLQSSDKNWILRVRFLAAVVQVAPIPTFDQVACQLALDGQSWNEGGSPDPELRATLGLREIGYWRLWALVLTPFKDIRQPYLLPAEETVADGDMLASCDELLNMLISVERGMIKAHLWDDLKPWLVRWQMEHLLAASTGSNKPRSRFAPSLAPYTSLYRIWQDPSTASFLPSEIIIENARRGAFASMFEVVAAFEGGNRLINDPVHGLIASQKRALTAANRYNPRKFKTVSAEFGDTPGGTLLILLLPLGIIGLICAIFMFSANIGQALGLTLALAGIAGVVALNVKK